MSNKYTAASMLYLFAFNRWKSNECSKTELNGMDRKLTYNITISVFFFWSSLVSASTSILCRWLSLLLSVGV